MTVKRIVPILTSNDIASTSAFYTDLLGLEKVMDHGWIATLAGEDPRGPQLSVMSRDATAPVNPDVSIEVDDVDAAWAAAQRDGLEIVHPITNEEWGVRRFFVRDPDGRVVNVLGHG